MTFFKPSARPFQPPQDQASYADAAPAVASGQELTVDTSGNPDGSANGISLQGTNERSPDYAIYHYITAPYLTTGGWVANLAGVTIGKGLTYYSLLVDSVNTGTGYLTGTAEAVVIDSGGRMQVDLGGSVNGVTVNSGGYGLVLSGSTATNIVVNGGEFVAEAGAANNVTVANAGYATLVSPTGVVVAGGTVAAQGTLNGVVIQSGLEIVQGTDSGATVSGEQLVGDIANIDYGSAVGATVMAGGEQNVGFGVAIDTTVQSQGTQAVYGTAISATIDAGALQIVGGVASNTVLYGMELLLPIGVPVTFKTTVGSTGTMAVSGGVASTTTLAAGGSLVVGSLGQVVGVYLSGGSVTIANSGTIEAPGTSGIGIQLTLGGSILNGSPDNPGTGLIYGPSIGVQLGFSTAPLGAALLNYGVVLAGGSAGVGVAVLAGGQPDDIASLDTFSNAPAAEILGVGVGVAYYSGASALTNAGTMAGTGTSGIGVLLKAGGAITNGTPVDPLALISGNLAGADIAGTVADGINTINNLGTIVAVGNNGVGIGVTIAAGGNVGNGTRTLTSPLIVGQNAGVAISGGALAPNVINYGSITAVGSYGVGITLAPGGYVHNGSSQVSTAQIAGVAAGVAITGATGAGTVANYGTIAATGAFGFGVLLPSGGVVANGGTNGSTATIYGRQAGIDISGSPGKVVNYGTILGKNAVLGGYGVKLEKGGTVICGTIVYPASTELPILNLGTNALIYGVGGIDITGGAGTVIDAGTISGTAYAHDGVKLEAGGTVGIVGQRASVYGQQAGVGIVNSTAVVSNYGTIAGKNFGVAVYNGASATIVNGAAPGSNGPKFGATLKGTIGVFIGNTESGNSTIVNYGTIASTNGTQGIAIDLGSGNDTIVIGPRSTIIGYVANLHPGDQFVLPRTSGNVQGNTNGVVAATIGTLNGVQTLQIQLNNHGVDGAGTGAFYNIAIESSQNLAGDYFKVAQSGTNTVLTLTQGNPVAISVNAAMLLQAGAITGAGITVGIISGSFNVHGGMAAAAAAGALPANVKILSDGGALGALGGTNTDEGMAMAEIIHDIAPNAAIDFAAVSSPAFMANAIIDLWEAGCQVIVDDEGFSTVATALALINPIINTVVKTGTVYVTAGGNDGNTGGVIHGHPANPLALTVASINLLAAPNPPSQDGGYLTPPSVEPSSAPGETPGKPNVTAPDGGPTTLGLQPDGNNLDPFFGASAAAPAAAAVAALMLQANPQLSPATIDQIIESTATPIGQAATLMGTGVVNAAAAVAAAQNSRVSFYKDPQSALAVASAALSQPSGNLAAGATVQILLTMNAPVAVTGTPSLLLNDGGTAVYDAADSTPATGALVFDYTAGASDETPDLAITGVAANGATVADSAGDNADFSGLFDVPTGVSVNSPLVVVAAAPSPVGEVGVGQTAELTLTMNEPVAVSAGGGAPTLMLSNSGTATYDAALSNPASGALVFDYTVAAADAPTPNLSVVSVDLPTGTTIQDADGNNANFSGAATSGFGLQVDPAYVAYVSPSPTYAASTGQLVRLTLDMSEAVSVATTPGSAPTLSLNDGETATYDPAASDPSAGSLVFDYTVASPDQTPDLTVTGVNLNSASVTDPNGVAADFSGALDYPTYLSINSPLTVTQVTASQTGVAALGQTLQLNLTMSEPVEVDDLDNFGGVATLSLNDGGTATYDAAASDPAAGTLAFDYTVGITDSTRGLAITQVNLPGPIFADSSGNLPDFAAALGVDTGVQVTPAVLWTDPASGDTGYWTFSTAGDVSSFQNLADGNSAYTAVGVGDFDGSGQSEVLWENQSTGDTGYWTMSGGTVTGFDDLGQAATGYSVVGIGDFEGNGIDEVLWENLATGNTGYWLTNASGQVIGFNDLDSANAAYSVVGIGDFDASGHAEVLWEDKTTGDTGYWITSGGQVTGFNNFGQADTAYSIVGIGDFDGSGEDQVLWEDKATGDTGYWITNSAGQVTGFHDFGFADTAYTAVGIGDYNDTGNDTVLWENETTGAIGYWIIGAQGQLTGFHDLGTAAAAYHTVPS